MGFFYRLVEAGPSMIILLVGTFPFFFLLSFPCKNREYLVASIS
jgi:hypothetical protein